MMQVIMQTDMFSKQLILQEECFLIFKVLFQKVFFARLASKEQGGEMGRRSQLFKSYFQLKVNQFQSV